MDEVDGVIIIDDDDEERGGDGDDYDDDEGRSRTQTFSNSDVYRKDEASNKRVDDGNDGADDDHNNNNNDDDDDDGDDDVVFLCYDDLPLLTKKTEILPPITFDNEDQDLSPNDPLLPLEFIERTTTTTMTRLTTTSIQAASSSVPSFSSFSSPISSETRATVIVEDFIQPILDVYNNYPHLLNDDSKHWLHLLTRTAATRLSLAARCLFVRLCRRKGPLFSVNSLMNQYEEVVDAVGAVNELINLGLLLEVDALNNTYHPLLNMRYHCSLIATKDVLWSVLQSINLTNTITTTLSSTSTSKRKRTPLSSKEAMLATALSTYDNNNINSNNNNPKYEQLIRALAATIGRVVCPSPKALTAIRLAYFIYYLPYGAPPPQYVDTMLDDMNGIDGGDGGDGDNKVQGVEGVA